MTTSWPCFAAAMPPAVPRHDITVAFGASPPSRISSQPTSRRPCALRKRSIRRMNQLWSSSSSRRRSRAMTACATGLAFQRVFGASSPPMWMYSLGKSSMTSARTPSRNAKVSSLGQSTSSEMPHVVRTSNAPRVHDDRLLPPRPHPGQLGVAADLEPPALVLGEMPVEGVELECRHDVDVFHDEGDREEMPADVQVQAAIAEAGAVGDACRRD